MSLGSAAATIGHLVFGERGQKTSGWPTLFVGLLGELGPHQLNAWQAQLG